MLTAVKVAFCFCIIGVFEETVSWTIDLPQVRKYFFEKSLEERERYERNLKEKYQTRDEYPLRNTAVSPGPGRVVYDNIDTHSLHTDYDKYREHYADDYKYHGYMEEKVHDAVRNGSAYLEGLRRAIENYTQSLESCRRLNFTTNIIQFNQNQVDNRFSFDNLNLNFSGNPNILPPFPPHATTITQLNTNFTNFMSMSTNYTMFNLSEPLSNCMRADLASEHVRRLAQLAVWAASELQDKMYADKYDKHGHKNGHDHDSHDYERLRYSDEGVRGYANGFDNRQEYDRGSTEHRQGHDDHGDDTLILRLAWFLDRLAHLTGYDPRPENFVERSTATPSTETPPMLSMVPALISNEDLQRIMSCINGTGPSAERCALPNQTNGTTNPNSYMSKGWLGPGRFSPDTRDMRPSASENQEYIYSEQVFTDDDMPLSLPQRPAKTKRKRSVQVDPLQNFVQYYAKYKTWTGANQEEKHSSEVSHTSDEPNSNLIRTKRFLIKKKAKEHKPKPIGIGGIVKHKLEVAVHKKEEKVFKKFVEKLHKPKTELKLLKLKKSKRSIKYSKKERPRAALDPQMDISYYVKNKPATVRTVKEALGRARSVRRGRLQAGAGQTRGGGKRFTCSDCHYECQWKTELRRHQRVHTGEKPFQCSHCDYKCREKTNLVSHERIHTGEKPFQCNQNVDLVRHERIHTGEKPFQCSHCGYKANQKIHLVRHESKHTGEKPFSSSCLYQSSRKADLKVPAGKHELMKNSL